MVEAYLRSLNLQVVGNKFGLAHPDSLPVWKPLKGRAPTCMIFIYMFPSPIVPSQPPPPMAWVHPGGTLARPPTPTAGGGRLAPVCARRCGRVCSAVRVLRCNAICSFCSTRQVAALSQLTVRDATTQFVVCSAATKC